MLRMCLRLLVGGCENSFMFLMSVELFFDLFLYTSGGWLFDFRKNMELILSTK